MNNTIEMSKTTESSLLSVDDSKCIQCETCIEACPSGIISIDEKSATPVISEEMAALCLHCGHCVAICPTASLTHQSSPLEDSYEIQKALLPKTEQVDHLLKSRRSVRVFKQKPVAEETIRTILNTTRYAPTGRNSQAVEWIVINSGNTISKVKVLIIEWIKELIREKHPYSNVLAQHLEKAKTGADPMLRKAPVLIIAKAGENTMTGTQDVDIALAHLEITAMSHGLGTCWSGLMAFALQGYEPLRKELGLNDSSYYAMIMGYPKFSYKRLPKRKEAKIIFK